MPPNESITGFNGKMPSTTFKKRQNANKDNIDAISKKAGCGREQPPLTSLLSNKRVESSFRWSSTPEQNLKQRSVGLSPPYFEVQCVFNLGEFPSPTREAQTRVSQERKNDAERFCLFTQISCRLKQSGTSKDLKFKRLRTKSDGCSEYIFPSWILLPYSTAMRSTRMVVS